MKISILISTLNRCEKLKLLLDSLKKSCRTNPNEIEVLILDNVSIDATKEVVANYLDCESPVFRYILLERRGKCDALNKGMADAKGDIFVFTDDDCVPSSSWISCIASEFEQDPALSVLGGRVELYNNDDMPQAISLSRERIQISDAAEICQQALIIGANMAWRGRSFQFDPVFGPGAVCRAAEDIEILYRFYKAGRKIVYSPEVVMLHNHGRNTQAQDMAVARNYAIGRGAFYCKHILQWDNRALALAFSEVYGLSKTLLKGVIVRKSFPYHKLTLPALFLGAFYYLKHLPRKKKSA